MSKLVPLLGFLGLSLFSLTSQAEVIRCASDGDRYRACHVRDVINDVDLVRELSRTGCIEGTNWGYENNYIWVDEGCSADFEVNAPRRGRYPRDPGNPNFPPRDPGYPNYPRYPRYPDNPRYPRYPRTQVERIRCSADIFGYRTCRPSAGGRIVDFRLVRQRSIVACVYGRNYGATARYIWVSHGCRGDFRVTVRRPRGW